MFSDGRIPILFDAGGAAGAALLVEGASVPSGAAGARFDLVASGHAPGCACCRPRGPVAEALSSLFTGRARGDLPYFSTVLALGLSCAGRDAVRDAVSNDPVVSARFRLAG